MGLIIVEATSILANGKITPNCLGLWDDEQISSHSDITKAAHKYGAKIAIQLNHSGRKCLIPKARLIAPSNIPFSQDLNDISVLDKAGIKDIISAFVRAAKRAELAGYDAVELHAAHGYLLSSFLSPLSNTRSDEYGGSFDKRIALLCECVEAVRAAVSLPVFVRLSASEWEKGGWDIADSLVLAKILEELGIELLDVSAGGNQEKPSLMPALRPLYQCEYSKLLKQRLNIPVSCVGLIKTASEGEALLLGGVSDLICYGRALLANPNFALKAAKELGYKELIFSSYIRAFE